MRKFIQLYVVGSLIIMLMYVLMPGYALWRWKAKRAFRKLRRQYFVERLHKALNRGHGFDYRRDYFHGRGM